MSCPRDDAAHTELETLRTILGEDAADDTELRAVTLSVLPNCELSTTNTASNSPDGRECHLARAHSIRDVPYLVHTGYELFLMLEGVKPFAKFADEFPEEALFEPHVRSGTLIKRVMADESFEKPIRVSSGRMFEGVRQVFYARQGE